MPMYNPLNEQLQERIDAAKLKFYNYSAPDDFREAIAALTIEQIVDILYESLALDRRVRFAQLWKIKQGD